MKHLYYLSALVFIVTFSSCSSSRYYQSGSDGYQPEYDQQQTITYQQFYNELSPYGDWVNYGDYGYAWVPNQQDFRPYLTNGYWVYTSYGWTWVSNYRWGWAPFHYGRWIDDMRYGWVWIPGYEWAPAWVSWRTGGDYYGWAPLAPGMDPDMQNGAIPYDDWTFVPRHYINSERIDNYYVNPSRNVTIINNTTVINNTTIINNGNRRANYNAGPPVREVEQSTGRSIRQYHLVNTTRPQGTEVSSSTVRVFRPAVQQQPSTSNPRPQNIKNLDEIRTTHAAPVREFPRDQTPQVLKNEPPVRNNPSGLTPERNNNPPDRVFPNKEDRPRQYQPVTPAQDKRLNPPANNPQPENRPANNPPVRVFPQTSPAANDRQNREQPARENTPAYQHAAPGTKETTPVRTFPQSQPSTRQNEYKRNENAINSRPANTPAEVNAGRHQAERPAPQPERQQNMEVRPVPGRTAPATIPQKQQEGNNEQRDTRTFPDRK